MSLLPSRAAALAWRPAGGWQRDAIALLLIGTLLLLIAGLVATYDAVTADQLFVGPFRWEPTAASRA